MQSSQVLSHDAFDMARLQKSLKQQHKHSLRQRGTITKLTPAEIRLLNNCAVAGSSRHGSSSSQSQRGGSDTPPLTPNRSAAPSQLSSRRNNHRPPTPPQSPEGVELSRNDSIPEKGAHTHVPAPQSYHNPKLAVVKNYSRPQSSSSYKSMPTYRGPEITRSTSVSMLQPSSFTHQIVDNPLSQFSRPRQPRTNISPPQQDPRHGTVHEQTTIQSQQKRALPTANTSQKRLASPERLVEARRFVVQDDLIPQSETVSRQPDENVLTAAQTVAIDRPVQAESRPKFGWPWRKPSNTHDEDVGSFETQRVRRRSFSRNRTADDGVRSVAYDNTKSGALPEERKSLKGDLPSDKTSIYSGPTVQPQSSPLEFAPHPAVRPLSAKSQSRPISKGSEVCEAVANHNSHNPGHNFLSDSSVPMYSRCSCCGKLERPPTSQSLTPMFENEHLRSNMSFELERSQGYGAGRRRSNSIHRRKYTPIIPMVMAEGYTVQAKIAPKNFENPRSSMEQASIINEQGDLITDGYEPVPMIPEALQRIDNQVGRFASLHVRASSQTPLVDFSHFGKDGSGSAKPDIVRDSSLSEVSAVSTPSSAPSSMRHDRSRSTNLSLSTISSGIRTPSLKDIEDQLVFTAGQTDSLPDETISRTQSIGGSDNVSNEPLKSGSQSEKLQPRLEDARPSSLTSLTNMSPKSLPVTRKNKSAHRTVTFSPSSFDLKRPHSTNLSGSSHGRFTSRPNSSPLQFGRGAGQKLASFQGITTRPRMDAQYMPQPQLYNRKPHLSNNTLMAEKIAMANQNAFRRKTMENSRLSESYSYNDDDDSDDNNESHQPPKDDTPSQQSDVSSILPLPQLGQSFDETSRSFNDYILPRPRPRSNLVESVLAATQGGDANDDYMRAFAR